MLSEFPDNGWKAGSINSLLKRIHKTGTIVWLPVRILCSVRRTSQKGTDQLI